MSILFALCDLENVNKIWSTTKIHFYRRSFIILSIFLRINRLNFVNFTFFNIHIKFRIKVKWLFFKIWFICKTWVCSLKWNFEFIAIYCHHLCIWSCTCQLKRRKSSGRINILISFDQPRKWLTYRNSTLLTF